MRKILFLSLFILSSSLIKSQVLRVAISDFENLSGNPKYDGLGKALSSMLISDIELNVSGKKMQLVERGQLNKILKEQNLQTSKSFDKASTVKVGKLLGINFILVGDIFVLNDDIVINARLTSIENGDIKFSNKQEGKLTQWLTVKTKIAKDLSNNLKVPFIEPSMPDKEVSPGIITKYASAIDEIDKGNLEKAATIAETVKEINPDFTYSDDLKKEIDKIKKEISQLRNEVETSAVDPIKSGFLFFDKKDYDQAIKYFNIGLSRIENNKYGDKYAYFIFLADAYLYKGDYKMAIDFSDSIIQINPYEIRAIAIKSASLISLGKTNEGIELFNNFIKSNRLIDNSELFFKNLCEFSDKHKDIIFDGLKIDHQSGSLTFTDKIRNEDFIKLKEIKYISELTSNGYTFNQNLNLDALLPTYSNLLVQANYKPLLISKIIFDLNISGNSPDLYENINGRLTQAGITTGVLKDTGELVIANTGVQYKGSVHYYNTISSIGRGIYSNISASNFIGGSRIECPCEVLIYKKVYKELKNNTGSIKINDHNHAIQIFNSSWFSLIGKDYQKSTDMFLSVIKYYIKLGRSLDGSGLYVDEFDSYRMAIINLAHSYLLSGNTTKAKELYNKEIFKKDFGKGWGNMTKEDVIKQDWNEFISKSLITQKEIDNFNLKYKIIN